MKSTRYLKTAASALLVHKTRSLLTILGIVIGIAAIILIVSLGQGAKNLILDQIQGMGSKTLVVIPGREPIGPSDGAQIFSDSLKERDLAALQNKANVPTLGRIMPMMFGGESSAYESETYRLSIFGSTEAITDIFDIDVEEGTFFTKNDIESKASVVIIGAKVKEELFGKEKALGEKIRIKNRTYRVIGILPKKGQVSFFNFDEAAIVPYTTAQQYIFGIKYFHRFVIEASSDAEVEQTTKDVQRTLRASHGITDPKRDDFFVQTQADLADRLSMITTALTAFLAAVASISLFVGGIGIMNIMLVSVTERTREIGLRKALGATNKDILVQFLLESVLLTTIGGIIGITIGSLLSLAISAILTNQLAVDWNYIFPWNAAFLGLGVAAIIGLVFGIYPARQASKKSPMEALRYE